MNQTNCCNCHRRPAGFDDHCQACSPLWSALRKANERLDASRVALCGIATAIAEIRSEKGSVSDHAMDDLAKAVAENKAAMAEQARAGARYDRANPRAGWSI